MPQSLGPCMRICQALKMSGERAKSPRHLRLSLRPCPESVIPKKSLFLLEEVHRKWRLHEYNLLRNCEAENGRKNRIYKKRAQSRASYPLYSLPLQIHWQQVEPPVCFLLSKYRWRFSGSSSSGAGSTGGSSSMFSIALMMASTNIGVGAAK